MKANTPDYLKYWRIIRQYMKVKHGVSQADLDMLLFLHSEKYFSGAKFAEFEAVLPWDKFRLARLKQNGWIEIFKGRREKGKVVYKLSHKAVLMIRDIYRKLGGEEIPTGTLHNKMFKKNVSYTDKVYRHMILKMNEAIRQQRRQTPE
jgi:hypothetical protein